MHISESRLMEANQADLIGQPGVRTPYKRPIRIARSCKT